MDFRCYLPTDPGLGGIGGDRSAILAFSSGQFDLSTQTVDLLEAEIEVLAGLGGIFLQFVEPGEIGQRKFIAGFLRNLAVWVSGLLQAEFVEYPVSYLSLRLRLLLQLCDGFAQGERGLARMLGEHFGRHEPIPGLTTGFLTNSEPFLRRQRFSGCKQTLLSILHLRFIFAE